MKRLLQYQITTKDDGMTIKAFLLKQGFSGQNIIALKKMPESILLNGKWEYVNTHISAGDELRIHIAEEQNNDEIVPRALPFPIVYEDEDLLIINKPSNMPTHPSLNNYENTLANAALYYFAKQNIPYTFRCINRLDKDTTGLTILAKHMLSGAILSQMIADRKIQRTYHAIVSGRLSGKSGTIDAPIGRTSDSLITRCVCESGERAITHYHVLKEYDGYSLVSLKLETGRTHQIRVHMAHIGHPLIGDYLYHPDYTDGENPPIPFNRQALIAKELRFMHPITKEPLLFEAPYPQDMKNLLD